MRVFVSLLVLGVTFFLTACDKPQQEKDFLQFQAQQIDPYCLGQFLFEATNDGAVSLKECTKEGRENYYSTFKSENDFYAQEMRELDSEYAGMYYTYKYLGGDAERFVLELGANTGGSGFFSAIVFLKRENDTLRELESVGGGDRCNGGINGNSKYENGKLSYSRLITPADMFEMEGLERSERLTKLVYCAACCAATVNYENDKIVSYEVLANYALSNSDYDEVSKQQGCFNKHMLELTNGENKTLSPPEFKNFLQQTAKACRPHLY